MISLYDSSITDILPKEIGSKPEVQALGYAINRAIQRLMDYCKNTSVYASIDTLPEQVLDLLAIELNTPYYKDSMDIEVKRNMIKNTFVWYLKAGTAASVVESVNVVFGGGEIEEWFEYGGEPYHFKVYTNTLNSTDEMIQQLNDIVSTMQNVRSYLDAVVVEVMQVFPLYHGCAVEVIADSTTIGIDMDI